MSFRSLGAIQKNGRSLGAVQASVGLSVTAQALVVSVALQTTTSTGGQSVTVTPSAVVLEIVAQSPSISTEQIVQVASPLTTSFALQTPSIASASALTVSALQASFALQAATVGAAVAISASVLTVTLALQVPARVTGITNVQPTALSATFSLLVTTVSGVQVQVISASTLDYSISTVAPTVTALGPPPPTFSVDPWVSPRSRRKPPRSTLGLDLNEVIKDMANERFAWMGLRQADRDTPCSCVSAQGSPTATCKQCLGTGYPFTDYLVSGYSWMSTEGTEFHTEAGRLSTQIRNLVLKNDRPVRKFDQILQLDLDADGIPLQPFRVLKIFGVQDVLGLRGTRGRLEFWKCLLLEMTTTDSRAGDIGTSYRQGSSI